MYQLLLHNFGITLHLIEELVWVFGPLNLTLLMFHLTLRLVFLNKKVGVFLIKYHFEIEMRPNGANHEFRTVFVFAFEWTRQRSRATAQFLFLMFYCICCCIRLLSGILNLFAYFAAIVHLQNVMLSFFFTRWLYVFF